MSKDKEPRPKPPKEERPRRRRRGFPVILLLILILLAIIAVLMIFKPFGGDGFGLGGGNSGSTPVSPDVSGSAPVSDSSETNIAVIRIDGNDIFLDGEKCENAAALKDKITALGTKKDYEIDHSAAIKATYDEVKQVLTELENALDIKVNYNE